MVDVVAALIWDGPRFMICQRPAHKARGLLWEFVGGKVEAGESHEQALIRECREELAVTLSVGKQFMQVVHTYPDITVRLSLYHATIIEGAPQKLEHNDIRWITPSEIPQYDFCPADTEILEKIIRDYAAEAPEYLSEQIITYLGNKRALLDFIGTALDVVREELGQETLDMVDLFAGSGVVSRYFKRYARTLYANDLESYSKTINECYLANRNEVNHEALVRYFTKIKSRLDAGPLTAGFITELYSPRDDEHIQQGERAFYTARNARYIDTARCLIDTVPEEYRCYLLAPLLYEASVHNNTSGVFKGFYKNSETGIGQFGGNGRHALSRIMADIELKLPVFSRYACEVHVLQEDANALAATLPPVDLVYMDPPYNQHPYGSNYFMLNLINNYQRPQEISCVSGIPNGWNKSVYNNRKSAKEAMRDLCRKLDTKYLLISFSDDGFISRDEMTAMLSEVGDVRVLDREYNTFRACRNLCNRDIHVKEYLYLVKK